MIKKILHNLGKIIPHGKIRNNIKNIYLAILHVLNMDNIIYTEDYRLFLKKHILLQKNAGSNKYWGNTNTWNFSEQFPERYKIMLRFFNEKFLPRINKNWTVVDLGCANGEISFLLSRYVSHVDGFDISQNMIEAAKNKAIELACGVNITFKQGDIQFTQFDRKYNICILFGVLMYVIDDSLVTNIIKNIYANLEDDGYVFVKESLWNSKNNVYYLDMPKNYFAIYRSEDKYISMYTENNFKLIDKVNLETLDSGYKAVCMLFHKCRSTEN